MPPKLQMPPKNKYYRYMFYQNFVKYQPILVALADTDTENSQNQTNNVILVIEMSAEHISAASIANSGR